MTDLTNLTITKALESLKKKEFSSVELTKAYIAGMDAARHLNCYITETPELALSMAQESDKRRASGKAGLLEGIPLGIKDLFCTKNVRTTAGSKILENFVPQYESTVTSNLFRDGAVMLGKLNLDQFGMGTGNFNSYFGPVENPWTKKNKPEEKLVPGGSSGGSAAAVAARIAAATTGTDTGGSSRQPAAYCGVVGFKPTYGRCSRWGIVAFSSSLDQAGVFTRNVEDCALMMQSMAGFDPKDSTSANLPVPDYLAAMTGNVKGLKVGIPKEYRVDGMPSEIETWWTTCANWLKDSGAEIVDISLPNTHVAMMAYYIIAPAEASSNLARYDGVRYGLRVEGKDLNEMYEKTRAVGFGAEVKRRIMIGTYALSAGYYDAYYIKAQKVRRLVANDFIEAYKKCDVILAPTAPGPAFGFNDITGDPVQMYMLDIFTIPVNLAGLPGISIPVGLTSEGLPLGFQLIGPRWGEEVVFRTAGVLQEAAQFNAVPQILTRKAA